MSAEIETIIDRAVNKALEKASIANRYAPLLRDTEVAEMCACSIDWLRDMRAEGKGPPIIKIGKRFVRYPRDETLAWFTSFRVED